MYGKCHKPCEKPQRILFLYPFGVYRVDGVWWGVVVWNSRCLVTEVIVQVFADSGKEMWYVHWMWWGKYFQQILYTLIVNFFADNWY
jgi:hypothetical protein